MEAILDLPPMPDHQFAPLETVAHRTIAEWPTGTFLENLIVTPRGVIVSVLSEGRLDIVAVDETVSTFHQFDAPPTGLAVVGGYLFAAVGEPGHGTPELWRLPLAGGRAELWMSLDGLQFANGVTPFAPNKLLIAESWKGQLCLVDLAARRVDVWLEDEQLTREPGVDFLPGANGVKRYGNEVTVSSNGRALLLRAAVHADGSAGPLVLIASNLRVDDLAYDTAGRLYLTTHIGHTLDRLDRDGRRVTLAGAAEGLAGSTACAFGSGGELYVTTTGGILAPPDRKLQSAKLVRLETGATGHPLERAWEA